MSRLRSVAGCLVLGLLAGCSSAPIHYHTLVPVEPGPATAGTVQIEQINVPPQVDRSQLVLREGNSGLTILETEWWGATLADELHNALVNQLGGNGGSRTIGLRVDVQRFDSVLGQYALMDVRWRLRGVNQQGAGLLCHSLLKTPAGAGIDALVSAHQRNVRELASQVGSAASSNRCP